MVAHPPRLLRRSAPQGPDHHRDTDDAQEAERIGEHDGDIVTFRCAAPGGVSRCDAIVQVEHIDTEPMTYEEHRLAITTLAVLINQWKHPHDSPPETTEKAA